MDHSTSHEKVSIPRPRSDRAGGHAHHRNQERPRGSWGGRTRELDLLHNASPRLYLVLEEAGSLEAARRGIYDALAEVERHLYEADHPLSFPERANVQESLRVLKAVFGPINEVRTGVSALETLWKLVRGEGRDLPGRVSRGFANEFIHLFRGIEGRSGLYRDSRTGVWRIPAFLRMKGRKAARKRSEILDELAGQIGQGMARFPSGLAPEAIERREANREAVLAHCGGTPQDWGN
jgi:lysine 2,3-aminomutase